MWHFKEFEDLDVHTLEEIYRLRVAVFIVEQECPYQEIDGKDVFSLHIYKTDASGIIAYLRIILEEPVSIGRVIVRSDRREAGLGRELMVQAMEYVDAYHSGERIYLPGQAHLKEYYESFGFEAVSEMHLEDNIPHYHMEYKKEESTRSLLLTSPCLFYEPGTFFFFLFRFKKFSILLFDTFEL